MSFSSVQYRPSTFTKIKLYLQHFGECLLSISSATITKMVAEEDSHREQVFQSSSKKVFQIFFFYFYILLLVIRFITAATVLNYQVLQWYFSYDPMLDLFCQLGVFDRHLALVIWPAPILIIYYDYLVNFTTKFRSYFLAFDLIVTNRQDFYDLNPDVSGWKSSLKLLLCKERKKLKLTGWKKQLPNIGPLDPKIRFQAVGLATAHDLFLAITLVALGLLCPIVLYLLSLTPIWQEFSLLKKFVTFLNGTTILYLLWRHVKQALFYILHLHLIIFVVVDQQKANNLRLKRRLQLMDFQRQNNIQNNVHQQRRQLTVALAYYLRFHFQLIRDILISDRQLVSFLLFLLLLSMFGLNVFAMVALLTVESEKSLPLFEKSFLFVVVALQFTLTGIGLKPMVDAHRTLHSPARLLFRALKLSTYYEILTSGEAFAFSVGPVGKITSNALLQFLFVYAAFLIFATNLLNHKWTFRQTLNFRLSFTYLYYTVLTLRYLVISVCLSFSTTTAHLQYFSVFDPLNDLLLRMGLIDRYLAMVLWPGPLLFMYLETLVSFPRPLPVYLHIFDLIVLNREQFWPLNPQLDSWRGLLALLQRKNAVNLEQIKLKWRQLPHLGPIDHSIRARAVALVTAFDLFLGFSVTFVGVLCFLAVYALSLTEIWRQFSPAKKLILLVDASMALFVLWSTVRVSLFFGHAVNSLFSVQLRQQLKSNERLHLLMLLLSTERSELITLRRSEEENGEKVHKEHHHRQDPQQLSLFLSAHFLPRHFQLLKDMLRLNEQIISRVLFFLLTSQLGFNLYMVTCLAMKSFLSAFERTFLFALTALQSSTMMVVLRPMFAAQRMMHSPQKLLYKSVECLSSESSRSSSSAFCSQFNLHLKLKLSTYYEVLTGQEVFAFTVGPLGKITSNGLFQGISPSNDRK
ncbi:hypothetical protein TYRP_019490 [Tyrophagus putrescentiae]|nr:hypothetical protein TYRP_019490 [Tyrophagus putrescentiae]